ncbi:Ornithine carbamoyltransferase [Methanobacterium lacus]|jgi:ornithine carbamoyltransferase|uniref:Ornithine carbamoyltransferase n=1 Tax=Methanobacterium lacus (strain AL-21) TaxID=877455 RepID=F0T7B4_METLA|nr:ornithine carbamoyltransferase [Methanobacterium lacus]ADZ08343.1 Ornithine carbamoyltransferase [Methanobacterium lacus]
MKHLLSVLDAKDEIFEILELAGKFKEDPYGLKPLENKTLAMIFEKASTRTRISFEMAMLHLGGNPLYLSAADMQLGRGEIIEDTAMVMSRYVDGVMIRAKEHEEVVKFSEHSTVPVINGLTNKEHPCQALTDIFTIYEHKQSYNVKMAFLGDGNNVCNSLLLACAYVGMDMTVVCPLGYEPDAEIYDEALKIAEKTGSKIEITPIVSEGVKDADIIYTDVWVSMGDEAEKLKRIEDLKNYQVNMELLTFAKPDACVMHCLPAIRGQEITDEVMKSDSSIIWDQAENRMHVQTAVLYNILK